MFFRLILLATIFCSLVYVNEAERGASLYQNTTEFSCMRELGFEFFIIDGFKYDHVNDFAIYDINAASKQGVPVDLIFTPCQLNDPEQQVKIFVESLPMVKIKIVWINITSINTDKCSWLPGDFDTNCGFLSALDLSFDKQGVRTGFFSTQ